MWRYRSCLEWVEQMLDLYSLRESLLFFQSYRYKIAQFFVPNHEVHRLFASSQILSEQGIHYKSCWRFRYVSSSSNGFWNSATFLVVWMVCLFCSLICWRWMTRIILAATPRMTRMDTRLILVLAFFFIDDSPYSVIDPIIPFERKDRQVHLVMI